MDGKSDTFVIWAAIKVRAGLLAGSETAMPTINKCEAWIDEVLREHGWPECPIAARTFYAGELCSQIETLLRREVDGADPRIDPG